MPAKPSDVTEKELEILECLWANGESTIRQVSDKLYPGGTTVEYATVQTLLERLENKHYVKRDRSAFAHVFAARVERSDLIGKRLEELADGLGGGSWTPLLAQLIGRIKLKAKDRKTLQKIIEELSD